MANELDGESQAPATLGRELWTTMQQILGLDAAIMGLLDEAKGLAERGFDADDLGFGGLISWQRSNAIQRAMRAPPKANTGNPDVLQILRLFVSDQRWLVEMPQLNCLLIWRDRYRAEVSALAVSARRLLAACDDDRQVADAALNAWRATNPYQKD